MTLAMAEPELAGLDPAALVTDTHVHRRVYTDPAIFRREMEVLFRRAWCFVGHESLIRQPGDFFLAHVGGQALIITRDREGAIRGLYNRCAHRGPKMCLQPKGSVKRFVCPYHGWAYDLDGRLVAVPHDKGYEAAPLDDRQDGLRAVAGIDSYRGFIFVRLAEEPGPDLMTWLGHMKTSIDDLVDRSPTGEVEMLTPPLRHHYRANWKATFENLNDTVHPGFAHAASVVAARHVEDQVGGADHLVPTLGMMRANGKPISFFENSDMITTPYGHSYIGGHMGANYSGSTQDAFFKALASYHGEDKAKSVLAKDRHLMLLYPSSTWHARYQTVRIIEPIAVDRTEVIGYVFRLVGAPDETLRNAIEYCNGSTSAASPVIADDLEIYERAQTGNQTGAAEWIPMTRGAGQVREETNEFTRTPATSEAFIRNQFRAWAELMRHSP